MPSVNDVFRSFCLHRATSILNNSSNPGCHLFALLPSDRCSRTIKSSNSRFRSVFYPRTICDLTSTKAMHHLNNSLLSVTRTSGCKVMQNEIDFKFLCSYYFVAWCCPHCEYQFSSSEGIWRHHLLVFPKQFNKRLCKGTSIEIEIPHAHVCAGEFRGFILDQIHNPRNILLTRMTFFHERYVEGGLQHRRWEASSKQNLYFRK